MTDAEIIDPTTAAIAAQTALETASVDAQLHAPDPKTPDEWIARNFPGQPRFSQGVDGFARWYIVGKGPQPSPELDAAWQIANVAQIASETSAHVIPDTVPPITNPVKLVPAIVATTTTQIAEKEAARAQLTPVAPPVTPITIPPVASPPDTHAAVLGSVLGTVLGVAVAMAQSAPPTQPTSVQAAATDAILTSLEPHVNPTGQGIIELLRFAFAHIHRGKAA